MITEICSVSYFRFVSLSSTLLHTYSELQRATLTSRQNRLLYSMGKRQD